MRVFAAVVLGATNPRDISDRAGVTLRDCMAALRRLREGGLIEGSDDSLFARTEVFREVVRDQPRVPAEPLDPDAARASVLRAFLVDGRLTAIPAARGKRRVILEHLARAFEPGVRYLEKEVDAVLRAWHPDHASLRRHLVDEELLARDAGVYWRIGGPV